ncbi:MAG: hypothetical protein AB1716_23420, partial [Planctomycetota bacterium]
PVRKTAQRPERPTLVETEQALDTWEFALEETRARLHGVAEGWAQSEASGSDETELDCLLRGLDTAFDVLES